MTISATGRCSRRGRAPRTPAGFTLLEVLVVVLIIGIVLTFAVLSLGGDRRGEALQREAQQFSELLRLAGEQTVMRGEEWGVEIDAKTYRFLVYTDTGWTVQNDDPLFRERALNEDTRLEVELEGREIVLGADKQDAKDEDTTKDKDKADEPKPTLFILSSGEMSPFVARFSAPTTDQRYEVKGDARGKLSVELLER